MGFGSAGHRVFDPVAKALVEADADPRDIRETLGRLIDELRELDWDTEHDSLQRFADCPAVVEAFRDRGITLPEQPSAEPTTPAADSRLTALANRNAKLSMALQEAIRAIRQEHHPQFHSNRSGWIPNSHIERWEALIRGGSDG